MPAFGQGIITTIAGTSGPWVVDGTPALAASIPIETVAADSFGNVYVGVRSVHRVYKVDPQGTITLFAGNGFKLFSGDGGPATSASLAEPQGLAVDAQGNVYIADSLNERIRKVDLNGIITTIAGSGTQSFSVAGGPALEVSFYDPRRIALDSTGNIYFTDAISVRKLTPDGMVSTIAGNGAPLCNAQLEVGDGGLGTAGCVAGPIGIAVDTSGNVYLSESLTNRIRRVDTQGIITTFAGDGVAHWAGDGGQAASASLNFPEGIGFDPAGNLVIGDAGNNTVRRIDGNGIISTLSGHPGLFAYGDDTGLAISEPISEPIDIGFDADGNILVLELFSGRVRRIDASGTLSTVEGNGRWAPSGNGLDANSVHISPLALALDNQGNLLIADEYNYIRRLNSDGTITNLAGNGYAGRSGDGGPATSASFNYPMGIIVDSAGNILVADTNNAVIRRIDKQGTITTFVGNGLIGPEGMAFDAKGNLYVADSGNNRIAQVSPSGALTTIVGNGQAGFSGDGGPALKASLNAPQSVVFDHAGNMFIADSHNDRIRKVDIQGNISTIAGSDATGAPDQGARPTDLRLNRPEGLTVDGQNNIYFVDTSKNRAFEITSQGIVVAIAGHEGPGTQGFSGDGGPAPNALLNIPTGILADSSGNLFIADNYNRRVREVLGAPPSLAASLASISLAANSNGAVTQPQVFTLSSSLSGAPYLATASTNDGGAWLRVNSPQGITPGTISISADPTNLAPGSYQGAVTVNMPGYNPPSVAVSVKFIVTGARPAQLSFQPAKVSFVASSQSGPQSQVVFVAATNGSVAFQANSQPLSGGGWLQAGATNPTASPDNPGTVTLVADPTNLDAGTYTAVVSATGPQGQLTTVPVEFTVTKPQPHLKLSWDGLTFRAQAASGNLPQYFGVLNVGSGVMNWTAATDGSPWLQLIPPVSGSTDAASLTVPEVAVAINPKTLNPGTYTGKITVSAPGADNSPQSLTVKLQVIDANQDVGVTSSPNGLIFTTYEGSSSPGSQAFTLTNFSNKSESFGTGTIGSFVKSMQPDHGSLGTLGSSVTLPVQLSTAGMGAGVYNGQVSLEFGNQTAANVQVLLVVVSASAKPSAAAAFARPHDAAPNGPAPGSLQAVFTHIDPAGFTAPLGLPFSLEVSVVDDLGQPMTTGSVIASFSNGDPAIALTSLKDGRWTGTWTPTNPSPGRMSITARAQLPSGNLTPGVAIRTGVLVQ